MYYNIKFKVIEYASVDNVAVESKGQRDFSFSFLLTHV
jgi:hypothetical protein